MDPGSFILSHTGLFAAAFLAATVLPFQSELVLIGLLVAEPTHWAVSYTHLTLPTKRIV